VDDKCSAPRHVRRVEHPRDGGFYGHRAAA
jgi:hypothetical protein